MPGQARAVSRPLTNFFARAPLHAQLWVFFNLQKALLQSPPGKKFLTISGPSFIIYNLDQQDMTTLYLQTGHDSAAVFHDKEGRLRILEAERFNRIRYTRLSVAGGSNSPWVSSYEDKVAFFEHIQKISAPITKVVYHNHIPDVTSEDDRHLLPTDNIELRHNHHLYHASSGFYASPFSRALILSIDGGGNSSDEAQTTMSFINIYEANESIEHIKRYHNNIGCSYGALGYFLQEIEGNDLFRLDLAGKIMGLCAYGTVQYDWIEPFKEYFRSSHEELWGNWIEPVILSSKIGLDLGHNSLSGQLSYDFMATAQFAFEEVILEILTPYLPYHNNFILTGGCALNVLLNQRVKKLLRGMGKDLYVSPDPNDCGLALGMYLLDHKHTKVDVFSGFDILDREILEREISSRGAVRANYQDLAQLISEGKIVGIVEGFSEIGPRALGHRSIICDPSIPGMKDTLNARVKFREWFRPFAPVCKVGDMNEFFDDVYESEFMSYAPTVKPQYRQKLAAVCHADNTARLQTVSKGIFYEILSHMKIPVLLNTSFNIKGKPILTRIADALECLDTTELDYVYIEGWLFSKR